RGALKPDVIQRARPRTRGFGVLNQLEAQPLGVSDPGVVVSCGADHVRVQSGAERERRAPGPEPVSWQRGLASGEKVVQRQAGLDEERSSFARLGGPSQQV